MNFTPGDFYLGIVDFLGVLVPGTVLVVLQGGRFASAARIRNLPTDSTFFLPASTTQWAFLLGAGFIVGQLLLALSEHLNALVPRFLRFSKAKPAKYIHALEPKAADILKAGTAAKSGPIVFHAAISYLRLEAPNAVGEVDRHMADYKLLRNLVAVFLADLLISVALAPQEPARLIFDGVLGALSFLAFARMLGWAQVLAFQYCCLVDSRKKQPSVQS